MPKIQAPVHDLFAFSDPKTAPKLEDLPPPPPVPPYPRVAEMKVLDTIYRIIVDLENLKSGKKEDDAVGAPREIWRLHVLVNDTSPPGQLIESRRSYQRLYLLKGDPADIPDAVVIEADRMLDWSNGAILRQRAVAAATDLEVSRPPPPKPSKRPERPIERPAYAEPPIVEDWGSDLDDIPL